MGGINVKRWILGGVAAGVFIAIVEGIASMLYYQDYQAAMAAHNLAMEMNAGVMMIGLALSLISGLMAAFLYAVARPRFGPGPRTAVIMGVALFVGSYLLTFIGYHMMGLFPAQMLALWSVISLVEIVVATLIAGAIYREG
jgi:hypothetical protein